MAQRKDAMHSQGRWPYHGACILSLLLTHSLSFCHITPFLLAPSHNLQVHGYPWRAQKDQTLLPLKTVPILQQPLRGCFKQLAMDEIFESFPSRPSILY